MAAMRVLVDQSTLPMGVLDPRGQFLYANQALADLFGRNTSPDDFPGVDCSTLFADEAAAEFRERVLPRAIAEAWEGSLRLYRNDGQNGELHVRLAPVPDDHGEATVAIAAEFLPARRTVALADARDEAADFEGAIPVLPVAHRVIVVPVVGKMDARRSTVLMRLVLAGINAHRARAVLIDVTGLSDVDAHTASSLAKTVMAARLKGAKTIVTGLSEQAAEVLVEIDVEWKDITTVGQLETGLALALQHVGTKLESTHTVGVKRDR